MTFTPTDQLQIAGWIEDAQGHFVDTIALTQQARQLRPRQPARPVRLQQRQQARKLARTAGGHDVAGVGAPPRQTWHKIVFQDGDDSALSHASTRARSEERPYFCGPMMRSEPSWDAGPTSRRRRTPTRACSRRRESLYPPRADVMPATGDSASVTDVPTRSTRSTRSRRRRPRAGATQRRWPAPPICRLGDYVLWIEVSRELRLQPTYNDATYPPPRTSRIGDYGMPYRGQPSVVYEVAVHDRETATTASRRRTPATASPTARTARSAPPDNDDHDRHAGLGRAAARAGRRGGNYRVQGRRACPGSPTACRPSAAGARRDRVHRRLRDARVRRRPATTAGWAASGGYEVRYAPIDDRSPTRTSTRDARSPDDDRARSAGSCRRSTSTGLLPETDYSIGIRAYDNCSNTSPLA